MHRFSRARELRKGLTEPDSARPTRRDKGATLVEMAMVFPILLLLLIGIAEIGIAFHGHLTVSYASREGARVAAFVGDIPDADCLVVEAVVGILGSRIDQLDRIEIFRADNTTGNQVASDTNVATYQGGDPSNCIDPGSPHDSWTITQPWPAITRQVVAGSQPLDIIGVRIVVNQAWITNFGPFSGTITLDEATIMRMEPEAYDG